MQDNNEELKKKIEELTAQLEEQRSYGRMIDEINFGLRKYLNEMTGVYRLLEAMNTVRSIEKVYELLLDIIANTIEYVSCAVYIYKDENAAKASLVKERNIEQIDKVRDFYDIDKAMYEWMFKRKHPVVLPYSKEAALNEEELKQVSEIAFVIAPLVANDKKIGYIDMLINKAQNKVTQQELSLLALLLNQTTIIIENLRMYEIEKQTTMKLKEIDEIKSDIMTTASHELRTPLTIIKGSAKIIELKMKEGCWTQEDRNLYTELIHNVNTQADILEEITNTLLAATKFENGEITLSKKVSNINAIIESVVKKAKYKTKIVKVNFKPEEEINAVIDADEIKKVLINILNNAVKYSNDGGVIDIRAFKDEKYAMITVKDYGIGIPKEEQVKIFDKFYRMDKSLTRKEGGIGFGLYISKIIIEKHGGNIWVDSEPNKGATFSIKLPLNAEQGG